MRERSQLFLTIGAVLNLIIALFHLIIIFAGPEAYIYFGAGEEMARMEREGSMLPDIVTLVLTIGFLLFALYGFSGAGLVRRFPARKPILVIIAAIYLLRGTVGLITDRYFEIVSTDADLVKDIVFSLAALIVGICYTIGTKMRWRVLG